MESKNTWVGHVACFMVYAIFGINVIVCKDLTTSNLLSPIALFTLRAIVSTALFWLTSLFLPKEKVEKKDYLKIMVASLLGFFLTQMSFLMALPHITPMDCSIVFTTSPIFTMLIAAYVLKEPITMKKALGVLLSLCGVIFLIFNSVSAPSSVVETDATGIVLIIGNSLFFAMYLGIFKPLIAKYSPVTFMKWIFLFSMLFSVPLSAKELCHVDYAAIPSEFLWELSFLIIFATFIAYFLLPVGQRRIRPTLVSMYSYVQPLIATVVSICIGMDTLTWEKIVAAIMVFGGVIVVNNSPTVKAAGKS